MNDNLHIIVTSEKGTPRTLLWSKKRIVFMLLFGVFLFTSLATGSFFATRLYVSNNGLNEQVSTLSVKLETTKSSNTQFEKKICDLETLNSNQADKFKNEKKELLNTAISELNERSQLIETVMNNIGVKVKKSSSTDNSGGPFIAAKETSHDELLFKSDYYLKAIKNMPIGRPVPGVVTSRFGIRKDPKNGKKSHHYGVDFRGKSGSSIQSTADGIVVRASKNGSFGRYIKINHGNGYTSAFAHLKAYKVKKGDHVKRGQIIALVGSSGRSTGPHLHYELRLNGKPVNPSKFMQINKLTQKLEPKELTLTHKKKVTIH